ncbi:hypothetical protein F5J12DRAFT_779054 [Pisolithus orientalis]|uniref:uncharacterized protein n=1 Tax=Pisolithus orientalis TaxID=936130 RepID=UPI00222579DF|nr:uncharacterized protein F5J12DRAFT_779054 [Pisolithus orientalis]KAI6032571.1 hypothetical protein F5J12DRAFT_779054 [Pisolithus orientalis]
MDDSFMDASHDSDSEEVRVYGPRNKGKRKADESLSFYMSTGESGSSGFVTDVGGYNLSHITSMALDGPSIMQTTEIDSGSTVSMAVSAVYVDNASSSDDDSVYESLFESAADQDVKSTAVMNDDMDVDDYHLDLASSVRGLYRILDLITEQGSGGLVDKIIISQNSLKAFINLVCPGAYASITKVDFKALDNYIMKPVGLDNCLRIQTALDRRSLLFDQVYVFSDQQNRMVKRNKSLLYLTKMCDQVVALISAVHAQTIVWNDGDGDGDDNDARTEDDEGGCSGKVISGYISYWDSASEASAEQGPPEPFLLFGETAQGFMTVQYLAAGRVSDLFKARHFTILQLEGYLFLERASFPHPGVDQSTPSLSFREIAALYPNVDEIFRRNIKPVETISNPKFRDIKDQLCLLVEFSSRVGEISESHRHAIAKAATEEGFKAAQNAMRDAFKGSSTTHTTQLSDNYSAPAIYNPREGKVHFVRRAVRFVASVFFSPSEDKTPFTDHVLREALGNANDISDSQSLKEVVNAEVIQEDPELTSLVQEAYSHVQPSLATTIPGVVKKLVGLVRHTQEETMKERTKADTESREEQEKRRLRLQLIRCVNNSTRKTKRPHTFFIESVEEISGARETQEDPMTCFTVHTMSLMEQDKHDLQLDPSIIPSPRFRFEYKFRRAQLLEGEKLLLIVSDRVGNVMVYLDHLTVIDAAIGRGRGKSLNREKIGQDFVLAFDESKRMLSVVSSDKLLLHIFVYDDARGFQALGSSINLTAWYNEGTSIRHACFVSGSEELLLVDSLAQARIYSLVTMQFRLATLNLYHVPSNVYSTPDGSCLLISYDHGAGHALTAYHWTSFGSTEGIELNIPDLPIGKPFVVTSLISTTAVHLLWLDFSTHRCQSYALDITRRITEFMFREKVGRSWSKRAEKITAHNCLVDCHSEVWIRFPVLAAVQRETISSASLRSQRTLVFVTDRNFQMFAQHFSDMIYSFEHISKKPTSDILKSIKVSAAAFSVFAQELCGTTPWNVSQYRAGEWIVDFLCLIPIHIALTKENRFIPLKDGVYSTELERSLLGAEVSRIVDSISFGWYESLFQSYMATKPVRVVSSIGEQSVGKSYTLNHLVDTSFAGSAMRTTEGVWMSITPTEKELIVALDFEGVHSIERSAQEDMLLVLFNTAISNLVLFRNNFAFSRDIAGLFQSFQSSATVLDPAASPSLFQSTLVIIINDVVEPDRTEVAGEFTLKFQRIVQDEQEANFITRLHAGKPAIIPCLIPHRPVIESKEFYKLFPMLKRRLDQQVVTHHAAGEFLHEVKTLMAKLKANDWGAMSQTMASHRAQPLSSLLPNALAFGFQEVPEREPLKNLDTDMPVELPDTESHLFLAVGMAPQSELREQALAILQSSWERYRDRQHIPDSEWVEALSQYLEGVVNLRTNHVKEWLSQNLSRFQTGHASIEELRRNFEGATVDLKSNTSRELRECNMAAGHSGKHMLPVTMTNICVPPRCTLAESLSGLKLADGSDYSCPGLCRIPSLSLDRQEYLCTAMCFAQGICEIETAPHSIEATFTGRHETFQYTKYSQVAKRLKCIKPIPPGATKHDGSHNHSLDQKVIHFCEARCENCGYFCGVQATLSKSTKHATGSMSRTQWTIDGTDDAEVLEIEGRRFSTNDEGAPMMCNLVCQAMGRHVHIDYCRTEEAACVGNDEIQHITKHLLPHPDRPKDYVTHNLHWKRSGKIRIRKKNKQYLQNVVSGMDVVPWDPSLDQETGLEHAGDAGNLAQPSYCTLPMFHPPADLSAGTPAMGYISNDGHHFACRNPVVMQQAFHVFGAVLSSLFSFWSARAAAVGSGDSAARRDAYSIILFNHGALTVIENDLTSNPDQLLDMLLSHQAGIGTNFTAAVIAAQDVMERNWSTERQRNSLRSPVIIFLSDGESWIADQTMQDLCGSSVHLGKAVSFHAVSFGPDTSSEYLRRMAEIAIDAQNNAPRDPFAPAAATVMSSYNQALDSVQLAETFLGIAESLRKPRGA